MEDIEDEEEELLIRREKDHSQVRRRGCRRTFITLSIGVTLALTALLAETAREGRLPLGTRLLRGVTTTPEPESTGGKKRPAAPMIDNAMIEEDAEATFWSTKVMLRQMAVY